MVGWDNRSSSFWPRSSDHLDHFGKHQSGIYMPQGPEFIRCDYPNPLPGAARDRELDGIAQEIAHHLHKPLIVDAGDRGPWGTGILQ